MTDPQQKPAPTATNTKVAVAAGASGAAIAAMLAIAVPFTASNEGESLKPYWDNIGKVETVCMGDTQVVMRTYTHEECNAMLRAKLEKQYAPVVAKNLNGIGDHKFAFAAFTDLAYNAGPGAVQQSVKALWNSGRYVSACHFISNYRKSNGKVIAGLVYRRDGKDEKIGEVDLCMVDAVRMQMGVE